MMKYLSLLLFSFPALAVDPILIQEKHCFQTEDKARLVHGRIQREIDHRKKMFEKMKRHNIQLLQLDLVTDTKDQFGRNFCLIAKNQKLSEQHLALIADNQMLEDKDKIRKEVEQLKDPWGGKAVDLSGKPKIIRSCKSQDPADCDDLIITARRGEEDVIEYRFWLGAQSGEGLAVYKSPANALELTKVMNQLKKDKENMKYTFCPKETPGNFIEDAQITAK